MRRIAGIAGGRGLPIVALAAAVLVGLPGLASASVWTPAVRLTTSGAPYSPLAVGAFAEGDGSFLLSGYSDYYSLPSGAGFTTGLAGGVFSPPSGPLVANVALLPDHSSLVAWSASEVQQRASNGTFLGAPQALAGGVSVLAADAAGNATAAAVANNNGFLLHVSNRPFGGSSFAEESTPLASSGALEQMALVGLVVDPNGATNLTWLVNSTLYQARRGAGETSFSSPSVIASNVAAPSFSSNAAGRAAIVYYDGSGFSATVREPGQPFGSAADFTGPLTPSVAIQVAVAVAGDGSAATLVRNAGPSPKCGTLYSLREYRLSAAGSSWAAGTVVGGTLGDSASHPTLVGGQGSRIDASWSVDTSASSQECGKEDAYEILAGTLGSGMSSILKVASAPLEGETVYGNAYGGGASTKMALNACGAGALIVGAADATTKPGLFTSTSPACSSVAPPVGTGPPPPVVPAGPAGPSSAQLKRSLLSALTPSGRASKIKAILKAGGYKLTLNALSGGTVGISWYLLPKGAHLSKAKPAPILIATGQATVGAAGHIVIHMRLTAKGKQLLRHSKRLTLTAKGTFARAGQAPVIALTTFVLKN